MVDVAGRVAIVTGASSGIGEAIAKRLVKAGMRVTLAARSAGKLEALAAQLGEGAAPAPTDVTNEAQVERLFADTIARWGQLDILINNAGIVDATPTEDLSLARWREVLDANLTSAFLCARAAVRAMKPRGRGRIITIGSISARTPRQATAAYTTSKFALDGLTRALALDGRSYGLTAAIVHPGSTVTNFVPGMEKSSPEHAMQPEHVAELVHVIAAMPDEVNVLDATILPIAQPFLGRG